MVSLLRLRVDRGDQPPEERAFDAVQAALRAGSDGVLLSRKYSEMKLANLRGAGAGIKLSGLA